jgi:hypothetical protein
MIPLGFLFHAKYKAEPSHCCPSRLAGGNSNRQETQSVEWSARSMMGHPPCEVGSSCHCVSIPVGRGGIAEGIWPLRSGLGSLTVRGRYRLVRHLLVGCGFCWGRLTALALRGFPRESSLGSHLVECAFDTTHATLTTLHTRCEVGVRRDGTKALFSGGFRQGLRPLRDRATDGHKSPALSEEDAQGLLAAHTLPWRKSTSVRRGNGNHEWARHLEFPSGFSRGHAQRQNCPLSFVTES